MVTNFICNIKSRHKGFLNCHRTMYVKFQQILHLLVVLYGKIDLNSYAIFLIYTVLIKMQSLVATGRGLPMDPGGAEFPIISFLLRLHRPTATGRLPGWTLQRQTDHGFGYRFARYPQPTDATHGGLWGGCTWGYEDSMWTSVGESRACSIDGVCRPAATVGATPPGPLLLTWFNFNPSMDKLSHAQ